MENFPSRCRKVKRKIGYSYEKDSTLPVTRNGKPFLDWDQGMPLHKFLALVCRKQESSSLSYVEERSATSEKATETESPQLRITDMVHQ